MKKYIIAFCFVFGVVLGFFMPKCSAQLNGYFKDLKITRNTTVRDTQLIPYIQFWGGHGSLDSNKLVTKYNFSHGFNTNMVINSKNGNSYIQFNNGIIDIYQLGLKYGSEFQLDTLGNILLTAGGNSSRQASYTIDSTGLHVGANIGLINVSNPRWIPDKNYVDSVSLIHSSSTLKEHYISDVNISSTAPDTLAKDTLQAGTYLVQVSSYIALLSYTYAGTNNVTLERYLGTSLLDVRTVGVPILSGSSSFLFVPPFRSYVFTITNQQVLKFVVSVAAVPTSGTLHIYYTSILIHKI
jgi:hypothetical protein